MPGGQGLELVLYRAESAVLLQDSLDMANPLAVLVVFSSREKAQYDAGQYQKNRRKPFL